MATREEKFRFRIKQFVGFWNHFKQSKRGMFGIGIIIFFTVLALAAPLLTPYQPTGPESRWLSGRTVPPAWMRYLPGGENLSENMFPIKDPGFSNATALREWNISTTSTEHKIFVQHVIGVGANLQSLGSVAILYQRGENEEPLGMTNITFYHKFYYPYHGPPQRFDCSIAVLIEGAEKCPVQVTVFLKQDFGEHKTFTWGMGTNWAYVNFKKTSTKWITPYPAISSSAEVPVRKAHFGTEEELSKLIFTSSGNYSFGVTITFFDTKPNQNVETTVYIDNLNIKLIGTCFGLLGTDYKGADVFTKLVYGTRVSLYVGLLSAFLSIIIGLVFGLIAGYAGGFVDELIMRFTDVMLVLPGLPLLMVLMTVLGSTINNLIILIGFLGWMGFARVIRSQVLSLKERPYIEAAKAVGATGSHILARHILPNVMGLVYVSLAMSVPGAIVSEASLSWLGFYDPHIMSWGRMLYDVQTAGAYMAWWWVLPPGICIAVLSLSFILLGYAIDDILNPKLRVRR
ncbi:MAG: ABC transporter permease [Candidatus Baldrarchaeia archaeon]